MMTISIKKFLSKNLFASNDIISVKQLELYKKELKMNLSAILQFWQQHTIDTNFGGFYGRLDNSNKIFAVLRKVLF